jgi:AraC family transcriptional regulator
MNSLERLQAATESAIAKPWATAVVELLKAAQHALGGGGQANQFIERAEALVTAEVEQRTAADLTLARRPAHVHLAPWQARRAMEFVEANLAGTIKVEDLARAARLSTSHFSTAFREDFGEPPYAYVVRRRISRAQEMMLLTDEPLAEIAVACGLADQCHLTRLFRRIIGTSPGNWRRARRVRPQHSDRSSCGRGLPRHEDGDNLSSRANP